VRPPKKSAIQSTAKVIVHQDRIGLCSLNDAKCR
jgi:hypothetical protein